MTTLTTDRDGWPWMVYPDGYLLCAAMRPYHKALLEDGTCDCATRESETIATFRLPLPGPKAKRGVTR